MQGMNLDVGSEIGGGFGCLWVPLEGVSTCAAPERGSDVEQKVTLRESTTLSVQRREERGEKMRWTD
ncbi:hypothetical protein C1H46_011154 [Malus baccata]|uniref:Uncharacterized protein n=1 Tax=Malus baccata TaxID=106549 RepID=A0A540MYA7_MALBA|nr:hypothetical protein C1H46_011154 [Malus baccata]